MKGVLIEATIDAGAHVNILPHRIAVTVITVIPSNSTITHENLPIWIKIIFSKG